MNRLIILSLLGLSSAVSVAASQMYLRADVGDSFLAAKPDKVDYLSKPNSSLVYGLGLGFKVSENIRTDITLNKREKYSYSHFDSGVMESQDINSSSLMINGYYNFINNTDLTPYIMTGVGIAHNQAGKYTMTFGSSEEFLPKHAKNNFAFQFGGGVGFKVIESISLDLGYKYVNLGKISTKRTEVLAAHKGGLTAHEVSVGLIYNFN